VALSSHRSGGAVDDEPVPNFDNYLPEWLAGHNKVILGIFCLFGATTRFEEEKAIRAERSFTHAVIFSQ
jgi:hypothetical protein